MAAIIDVPDNVDGVPSIELLNGKSNDENKVFHVEEGNIFENGVFRCL